MTGNRLFFCFALAFSQLYLAGCATPRPEYTVSEPLLLTPRPPSPPPIPSKTESATPAVYAAWDTVKGSLPPGYAAYGFVVFTAGGSSQIQRYTELCNAFQDNILRRVETISSDVPDDMVAVTYWPVSSADASDAPCDQLVRDYDFTRAQLLMKIGRIPGTKRGPFLIATVGIYPNNTSTRALVLDLSNVGSDHFAAALQLWRQNILSDPRVWNRGLTVLENETALVAFLNQYGCIALKSVGFDNHFTSACNAAAGPG